MTEVTTIRRIEDDTVGPQGHTAGRTCAEKHWRKSMISWGELLDKAGLGPASIFAPIPAYIATICGVRVWLRTSTSSLEAARSTSDFGDKWTL